MKNLILMTFLMIAVVGCTEPPCDPGASRCLGNTVEVCNEKQAWRSLADCGELSRLARRPLVCAFVTADDTGVVDGNTCIPEPPATRSTAMAISRTGDWARARELLSNTSGGLKGAVERAMKQEAHALRNEVVRGLTAQAPGGEPIQPPAPLTLAARQLEGFGGTKSLLVRGDLRNAISVIADGDEVFIGVLRSAKSSTGESLADIAQIQEFGGPPVIIPITPKMRRYLAVLLKRAGTPQRPGSERGVVVTQIPARPFLRPAFEKFRAGVGRRVMDRLVLLLT